jgi:hypothetical protein
MAGIHMIISSTANVTFLLLPTARKRRACPGSPLLMPCTAFIRTHTYLKDKAPMPSTLGKDSHWMQVCAPLFLVCGEHQHTHVHLFARACDERLCCDQTYMLVVSCVNHPHQHMRTDIAKMLTFFHVHQSRGGCVLLQIQNHTQPIHPLSCSMDKTAASRACEVWPLKATTH